MRSNATLTSICLYIYVNATTVYLLDSSGNQLANATVGNSTGSPCGNFNYNMSIGLNYYVKADSQGAAYHGLYEWVVSFPQNFTYFTAISGSINGGGGDPTNWANVYRLNFTI